MRLAALVLCLLATLHARADAPWTGKSVMPRAANASFRL